MRIIEADGRKLAWFDHDEPLDWDAIREAFPDGEYFIGIDAEEESAEDQLRSLPMFSDADYSPPSSPVARGTFGVINNIVIETVRWNGGIQGTSVAHKSSPAPIRVIKPPKPYGKKSRRHRGYP